MLNKKINKDIIIALSLTIFLIIIFALIIFFPAFAQQVPLISPDILTNQTQAFRETAGFEVGGNIYQIIAFIIKTALSLLGVIFLILIIYGGFLWMTAGGNEEQIKKAKSIFNNSAIALLIILAAYAITHFVVDVLINATGGGGEGVPYTS